MMGSERERLTTQCELMLDPSVQASKGVFQHPRLDIVRAYRMLSHPIEFKAPERTTSRHNEGDVELFRRMEV
jgi:hypothetical protein